MNHDTILTIFEISFNSTTTLFLAVDLKQDFIVSSETQEEYQTFLEKISENWRVEEKTESNCDQLLQISDKIKSFVVLEAIQKESRALREWRKNIPKQMKGISAAKKSESEPFQQLLFESDFFQKKKIDIFPLAIKRYNSSNLLVPTSRDESVSSITSLILQDQSQTRGILKQGFTGLAIQNVELLKQNQELKDELQFLRSELKSVSNILEEKLEKERFIEQRKKQRLNRRRLPKREPMTFEYYQFIMAEAESNQFRNYRGARLRLALALLLVTGVRITELLPLRMTQVKTLFSHSWIAIDRAKRGPANHKAFLTNSGKKILKDRLQDLEMISYFKDDHSFLFTAENSEKPLKRETFNTLINSFLSDCGQKLDGNPNLKSHSFRIGFINKLWRDTKDIEFVRQSIGHATIGTTAIYMKGLSDTERKERMLELD